MIAPYKNINEIVSGIDFEDKRTGLLIRLNPIILHVKERLITLYMPAEHNPKHLNFSQVSSEWLEFIEASLWMIMSAYLDKRLP